MKTLLLILLLPILSLGQDKAWEPPDNADSIRQAAVRELVEWLTAPDTTEGHALLVRCDKCQVVLWWPCKKITWLAHPDKYIDMDNRDLFRRSFKKAKVIEFYEK